MNVGKSDITFEESAGRLKVTLPSPINWPVFGLHTLALLIWLGMLAAVLVYLFRGLSSSFVLTIILLVWMIIWLWFGRFLWSRWQYHAASREILFADDEQLVVRRPVSILGLTWVYDINHVSGLYYSEQHGCPAFDYAYQHVYFGHELKEEQAKLVINELNGRFFPNMALEESGELSVK
ncbi:MAG: hypothetical protein JSW55_02780 [Chloroflexota bacterium]|nr:MAG: hypothetical protein JSW55_02780 [Chloroflexota bacterium]